MIIKFFHQGQKAGDYIVQYLLSEEKHDGVKPEVVEGDPELTRKTINSLKFKNKYTTGVISFRQEEQLTRQQQHELIQQFEATFCPFDDPARVNFLWVKHYDKGRLELHFLVPRVDLKTGKTYNIHPPGKANLLFFEAFTRLENMKHGFDQVDGRSINFKDKIFYIELLNDLFVKRKKFLYSHYDKPKIITKGRVKNGEWRPNRTKGSSCRFNGKYTQFRNISSGFKFSTKPGGSFQRPNGSRPNRPERSHFKNDASTRSVESFAEYTRLATEAIAGLSVGIGFTPSQERSIKPNGTNAKPFLSVEDEILALAIELNYCSPAEAPAIIDRLNYLQGYKETLKGDKPKFKPPKRSV